MKSTTDDLDWLAFRYISGELEPDEAASFELLLSDDQGARDAVVRAVELSQALVAAMPSGEPRSVGLLSAVRKGWTEHLAWFASGVAACLLVALALNFAGQSPSPSPPVSNELADAWLDQATEPDALTAESTFDADYVTADAPSWMVEAVRSLHSDGSLEDDDSDAADEMES